MNTLAGLRVISDIYAVQPATVMRLKRWSTGDRRQRRYWALRPVTVMQPAAFVSPGGWVRMHPEVIAHLRRWCDAPLPASAAGGAA